MNITLSAQDSRPSRPSIVALGPSLDAVSGVSTHLNLLLRSQVARRFSIVHFQVGSEGRSEGSLRKWVRFAISPFALLVCLLRYQADIVHLNTSLEPKSYWRDLVYLIVSQLMGRRVVYQVHGGALPHNFFPRSSVRVPVAVGTASSRRDRLAREDRAHRL